MPSSAMATWRATVGVDRQGSLSEATLAALPVADGGRARTIGWWDPVESTTAKFVTSLNLVAPPRVGLNPVIVTLHRMENDMMTFAPVVDAAMMLHPWMVGGMSHGAEGSVDPTPVDDFGRYAGQLAFSMRGEWETTVTISRGEDVLDTPKFTTSF
jgi:hypothetical protein